MGVVYGKTKKYVTLIRISGNLHFRVCNATSRIMSLTLLSVLQLNVTRMKVIYLIHAECECY